MLNQNYSYIYYYFQLSYFILMEKDQSNILSKKIIVSIDKSEYIIPIRVCKEDKNITEDEEFIGKILKKSHFQALMILDLEFSIEEYKFTDEINIKIFLDNLFLKLMRNCCVNSQ